MSTKAYCSKCSINWGALASQEDAENDECYEYCPRCKSDMFLQDALSGELYIASPIGGVIYNMRTGEPRRDNVPQVYTEPAKVFDIGAWRLKKELEEEKATAAIEEYQRVHALEGQAAAEKAFFNYHKNSK